MIKLNKNFSKEILRYYLSGFAMGSADVVPGVSGGTIAFILGIYEQLIEAVKTASGTAIKKTLRGDVKGGLTAIPWAFLVPLGLGIISAVLTLANVITYLLVTYPTFVWSFFFGLVLASIFLISKRVRRWNPTTLIFLFSAILLAYIVVGIVPNQTPATLPAFFISGAIAICAMILPGVSGSFLLILMGKYQQILEAVTNQDYVVIGVFLAGAVVGLALFARVLSWAFYNYHDLIVAALIGLMIGSLRKLWPFKVTIDSMVDSHGEVIPLVQRNVLPPLNSELLLSILLCGLGIAIILLLSKNSKDQK